MPVIRIQFPDSRAMESFAAAVQSESKGCAKEVRRAKERPGRTAELTEREVRAAYEARERMEPRPRRLVEAAIIELAEAEVREAARIRKKNDALASVFRKLNP